MMRPGPVAMRPADDGRVELSAKRVEAYRFLSEGLARIFGLAGHPTVGG